MKTSKAGRIWLDYHRTNSQKKYGKVLLTRSFPNSAMNLAMIIWKNLHSDHILDFLSRKTEGCKQQTKRLRFSHLSAFFNFIKTNIDNDFQSPCDTPLLRKMFKAKPTCIMGNHREGCH